MGSWMPAVGLMLGLSPALEVQQAQVNPWSTGTLALARRPEHPQSHVALVFTGSYRHTGRGIIRECLNCDNLRVVPDSVLGGRAEVRVPLTFDFTPGLGQWRHSQLDLELGVGADRVLTEHGLWGPDGSTRAWWTPSLHAGLSGGGRLGWTVGVDHDRVPTAVSEGYTAAASPGEPGWTRLTGGFVWRPTAKSRPERVDLGGDPDLD